MVAELGPDADELSTLIHRLQGEMNKAAEDLRFEEAAMLRDEIAELRALGLRDPVDGSAVPTGDGGILEETARILTRRAPASREPPVGILGAMADRLVVRGAREHNLQDVSLDLPRDRLIVFTGLSGSGKSSLAFDTIYAEGQRRYVESLSAYARQFLGQMDKPDVDFIEGLSPAISIDQKSASHNPRSTVGTVTEVYDYLRLLYARIGKPHCPECGRLVVRQSPQQIVDRILAMDEGTRFMVLAPVVRGRKGEYSGLLDDLAKQGFARVRVDGVDPRAGRPRAAGPGPLRAAHHRGGGRPAGAPRRHPPSSDRVTGDGAGPGRGGVGDRGGRPRRHRAGGDHLQPAPGLHQLRAELRGPRPAQLLLQFSLWRVPGLHRPRHPLRGRPRPGGARSRQVVGRRGARPVGRRPERVLRPLGGGGGRARRILVRHAVGEVEEGRPQARPLRGGQPPSPSPLPQPLRPSALVPHALRGHRPVAATPPHARRTPSTSATTSRAICARCRAPSAGAPASSPSHWP